MSWYVNYYVGIMDADKKIKPLGPYDSDGDLKCVHSTSRSFTSDLRDYFSTIYPEQYTDELKKHFSYECEEGSEYATFFGYLPFDELPTGEYIKRGYFLNEDIYSYMKDHDTEFYDALTPEEYSFKLENELKFGKPQPKKDCDGYEYCEHSCADYSYFCYPEYCCKEYEASLFRTIADILINEWDIPDGSKLVVIKTEG